MKHFKDISFWCIVLGVVVVMVVHHILSHKSDIIEGQQNDTVKCGSTEDEETGNPCCDYDLWYEKNEENEKCKCPATMRNGTETDGIFTTDSNGIQYGRVDDHVEGTELTSDPRCSNASLTTDKPTGCDKNNRFVDETSINNSTHFRCLTPTEVDDNILALARSLGIDVNAEDITEGFQSEPLIEPFNGTLQELKGAIETRKAKIDNYDIDITGKTGEDINQEIEDEEALRSKYCLDVNASASTLISKKITARARLSLSDTADEGEYDDALDAHAENCTYFNLNDEFEDCSNFSCSIDGEGGVTAAGATLDGIDSLAMNLSENPCCPHESNPIPNDGCISTLVADGKEEFWEYTYDTDGKRTNAGPYCRFFAESNPCAAEDSDVATCEFKQGGQCTETPADCETRIKEKLRVKCVDENLITDQNCPTLSDCYSACTWDKMNDAKNARLRGEINSNIAELNTFLEEAPSYEVSNGGVASYPFSEIDECQEGDLTASPAVEKETNGACDGRRLNKISTINELCRAQVPPLNTQGSDALIQCEESDILTIAPLYEFTSHTFTNCGKTGRNGPTLTDCMTAYGGSEPWNNTNFFNVTGVSGVNGIQVWTVPYTGIYKIIAKGAAGGHENTTNIGKGANIEARFPLIKGDKYMILIGQQGTVGNGNNDTGSNSGWRAGGGGGGSFMVKGDNYGGKTLSDVLIVAGGGGGRNSNTGGEDGQQSNSSSTGGGTRTGTTNGSGGGGGLLGNGANSSGSTSGDDGGHSFVNGGKGGISHSHGITVGGFGGGGSGGGNPGGGGGGINGGNTQDHTIGGDQPGGGGGSHVNLDIAITDTPPVFHVSDNQGHGSLEVTWMRSMTLAEYQGLPTIDSSTTAVATDSSTTAAPTAATTAAPTECGTGERLYRSSRGEICVDDCAFNLTSSLGGWSGCISHPNPTACCSSYRRAKTLCTGPNPPEDSLDDCMEDEGFY